MLVVGRHRLGGFAWSTSPVISGSQWISGGLWPWILVWLRWLPVRHADLKICAAYARWLRWLLFPVGPSWSTREEIGWRGEQKTMIWGGNSEILLEIPDGSCCFAWPDVGYGLGTLRGGNREFSHELGLSRMVFLLYGVSKAQLEGCGYWINRG